MPDRESDVVEGQQTRAIRGFAAPREGRSAEGLETRAIEVARGQRGVITLAQLVRIGFSEDQVQRRVKRGWLVRLHEGIFAIGTIGAIGKLQAGLWACGEAACAWDESSAALHSLLPYPAAVYVAVPRNGPRPPGLHVHRPTREIGWTRREGLRTADVPETLLALAKKSRALAQEATDQALISRRTSRAALTRFLSDRRGRRGTRILREIIEGPHTRSHAEKAFYKLLHAAKLPLPEVNVRVNGHLVDFYWPEYELIVETDGWASHGRRSQWEQDHRRDLDHFAAGTTTLRITARQLEREPFAIVAALTRRLAASGLPRATAAS